MMCRFNSKQRLKQWSATIISMLGLLFFSTAVFSAENPPPNIILILADDLGYGDVGAYGAVDIQTPNIDRLAAEGIRLTQFYASGNVCTPSRAGLLTGRYPIRAALADRTLAVGDTRGLQLKEVTLAEQLKSLGYTTALIGKWHLGDQPDHHPQRHGFDEFFGILYSNDEPEQSLLRGTEIVEQRIDPQQLAVSFVQESVEFISRNESQTFFLMLTSSSPHKPLIPSARFAGASNAGAYGDVVEELDWGVGEIMQTLDKLELSDNTLVIFTSDNGPFPQGSTAGLRGGKGTGWEGGYRVPFIAHWPGHFGPKRVSSAMSMNIDLMPSLLSLAGAEAAASQDLDGKDLSKILLGSNESPHEALYFFNNDRITALRTSRWRLMLSDYPPWRDAQPLRWDKNEFLYTLLFDMELDADQQYDLSRRYPDEKLLLEQHLKWGRENLESLSSRPDSTQYGDSFD